LSTIALFQPLADLGDAAGRGAYGEVPGCDSLGGFRERF
jgi:hypothetical protein